MYQVFFYTLNGVLPIFLVIFLGIFLRRLGFFSPTVKNELVKLVFYVGTPCLIFRQIASTDLRAVVDLPFLLFIVLGIPLLVVLQWAICFFIKDPKKKGAVLQLGFRSNCAIVGMPLALNLMSAEGVALTAFALSATIILYNVLGVIVLSYYGGSERRLRPVLISIAKNPLLISVFLGIVASLLGFPMSSSLFHYKVLDNLGTIASSIGLLVIGASISMRGLREDKGLILFSVFLRCVLSPICILGSAILLGFRGDALLTLTIVSATPSAINSYVMAKQMGVSENISAFGISFTSLFSLVSIFTAVFVLKISGLA